MKEIKNYYRSCEAIKDLFIKTYYSDSYDDSFWVGDEIGGVFCISDEFFGFSDMVTLLENKVSYDKMIDWYGWSLEEHAAGNSVMNLKNYLKSNLYNNDRQEDKTGSA